MSDIEQMEAMTFLSKEPDVSALKHCYDRTIVDIGVFLDDCRNSYNYRRNIWPGKTEDLRKHGASVTPWDGASDTEANVVAERVNTYVSLCTYALGRSHIQALAVSADDMGRAASVSKMMKYLRDTWIPDFKGQMEIGANFLFEKGIMVSLVSWEKELRTRLQRLTLEELEAMAPGLGDMIRTGQDDEEIAAMFQKILPVSEKRAKRAVRDLREVESAEMAVAVQTVDRPVVRSLAPDADVFWPAYVSDLQRSPVVFLREFLSPQELEKKVINDGWDRGWVDYMIENFRGRDTWKIDGEVMSGGNSITTATTHITYPTDDDLVMVVYAYQRLIDEEDGAEGIYMTVFSPSYDGENAAAPAFAKFELLDGFDDYPFVVTTLSRDQKRLYEVANFGTLLRGTDWCVKTERDQRIDRASLAMGPPLMHAPGRPPSDWGPFRKVPVRRPGEIHFGPIPPPDNGSKEMELTMIQQADRLVGLDYTVPNAAVRQQFYIDKFLSHARDVLKMARKFCRRFGPAMIDLRITGDPNAESYNNTLDDEDMDVTVIFDSQNTDPEVMTKKLEGFFAMLPMDRYGVINGAQLMYLAMNALDPGIAALVAQPVEAAQQQIERAVMDDLTKIAAGLEVGAQPNGAQVAMQTVSIWMQQPDVKQRYDSDEAFRNRVDKYIEQYQFQLQQAENAQIGRIGTAPADFQGKNINNNAA